MDKEVLKSKMPERFEAAMEEAIVAVESAPEGPWISGGEWRIRQRFQELMGQCFGELVQGRIDAEPTENQAAFSPSILRGKSGGGAAGQRAVSGLRVDPGTPRCKRICGFVHVSPPALPGVFAA